MKEQTLNITTPDGDMVTFLAMPSGGGPFAPVILFMDIWGMREQLRDVARFVAREGFACAAPSLYYRRDDTHFDHRHGDGKTKSIFALDPVDRTKMLKYAEHLTDKMAVSDAFSLIQQLRKIDGVSQGFAGCFGYCMGGRHAVRVAAAYPQIFHATASLHGTALATGVPDSPHLGAARIKGEIYFGYGELDAYTPPDVIETVRNAFEQSSATLIEQVHLSTDHGYAIPDRDVYSEPASSKDWETIFGMFRRQL